MLGGRSLIAVAIALAIVSLAMFAIGVLTRP